MGGRKMNEWRSILASHLTAMDSGTNVFHCGLHYNSTGLFQALTKRYGIHGFQEA